MHYLQNRWKLQGRTLKYYGLRNKRELFHNTVKLSARQAKIVRLLPAELDEKQKKALSKLLGKQIVEYDMLKTTPKSLDEATFCKNCVANDFIIPGLEFDDGLCPMCQTQDIANKLKSITPVKNTFPHSKKSRFDVAVFYTGGKDSAYLLYYLAKVQKLRVLACTWEIPFASECAKRSIEGAKRTLPNVEFISRKVSDADLRTIYRRLYALAENTCACPSLAYALFYPELVANKVPYFAVGNESAQIVGLYYNHMAPRFAYKFHTNKFLNSLINFGRILTFRPPYKSGQFHTMATMKQLAYGDSVFKKMSGYTNALVANVVEAIHQVSSIVKPLKRAIRQSNFSGNIPAFVQVDFDEICGGCYDWKKVKDTLIKECGWCAPADAVKGLHTSCCIEKCKEYSQFTRFYNMKSDMIPFSALEISLASKGAVSRERALRELREAMGLQTDEPAECEIMKNYLQL